MLQRGLMLSVKAILIVGFVVLVLYLADFSGIYWGIPIVELVDCLPMFSIMMIGLTAAVSTVVGMLKFMDEMTRY